MKNFLQIICMVILCDGTCYAQSNELVTTTEVTNILKGSYTPSVYQASTVITDPNIISAGLVSGISDQSFSSGRDGSRNSQVV